MFAVSEKFGGRASYLHTVSQSRPELMLRRKAVLVFLVAHDMGMGFHKSSTALPRRDWCLGRCVDGRI